MIVTLDTNVLYHALRSSRSASFFILSLVRDQKIMPALSVPVFTEYRDVLTRPATLADLNLLKDDIDVVLRLLVLMGRTVTIHYLFRPNLPDENDNMFVELALASNSKYLITSNIRDFTQRTELKFKDLNIKTPGEFVAVWKQLYQ